MKNRKSGKSFFKEEMKDSDNPKRQDSSPKGQRFFKSDEKPNFKKKTFENKEDVFERKSSKSKSEGNSFSGSAPKGKFFKEDKKFDKPSYGKRQDTEGKPKSFEKKRFVKDSVPFKKWEEKEGGESVERKPYGFKSDRFNKEERYSDKKLGFEKTEDGNKSKSRFGKEVYEKGKFPKEMKSERDKPFNRPPSNEKNKPESKEKLVYKGRGRDQKPVFGIEEKSNSGESLQEKRGFGRNRPKRVELNPDRPDYNFDSLPQKKTSEEAEALLRLNKYIANSGICSRREADELISKGLVTVNGEIIKEMGYKVKKTDRVLFEGKRINPEKPVYVLLNKPKDFITTTEDPMERKTVMKLVENACEERIFPVGRLDRNTTGLLLFTNDGELAAKLSHPSNEIKKIYQVTLDKSLTYNDEETILAGLTLEDGDIKVDDMQVLSKDRTILGLEIHIGRNRIVRRIFAHFGYEVIGLDRVMYAGLDKKDLKRGHYRFLTEQEVIRLKYYT